MSKIIIDDKLVERLKSLEDFAEFFSPTGKSVGFFCPIDPLASAKSHCPYLEEELEAMRVDPATRKGKPLAAVKEILKQRGVAIP